VCFSRRLKEAAKKGPATKKRGAPAAKKAQPAKKSKGQAEGDEDLARKLTGRRESARDRDANKAKSKKAAALAALKKEKKIQQQQQKSEDDSSEDSLEFGDDDDDDSDDDYEESGGIKPWQQKQKERATRGANVRQVKGEDDDEEDDDDDDMDVDEDDKVGRKASGSRSVPDRSSAPEAEAGLAEFLKVTIPRRRLARWCNEPFFNAAVLECFVRLFIGEDDSGEKVYRLCEIVDVKTSPKSYKMPPANKVEKPVSTNRLLRLKFGKSEKDFPMYLISDADPTDVDVLKYLTNQKNNRMDVLTRRAAIKLRRLQDNLVHNYTYTNEDIERNLQTRKKQGKGLANLGLEQTKVAIAVQAARDALFEAERQLAEAKKRLVESSDDKATNSLEESVKDAERSVQDAKEALAEKENEERVLNSKVEDRKRRLAQRKGDVDWAKVNERALQTNQRVDREALKIKQGPSVAGSGKKDGEFNPYARRRVKPKILWEVGQGKDESKADGDTTGGGGAEKKESRDESAPKDELADVPPTLVQESTSGLGTDPKGHGAYGDSHQFAIDEESLATSGFGSSKKGSSASKHRTRKGLSLSDYLEEKAAGTL
jgi:RNA polymerase-associated protein RTF1